MKIGELFKLIRLEKSLTQKLFYVNFCSRKEISRIENGKTTPSLLTFIHICDVLDISYTNIIEIWENSYGTYQQFNKVKSDILICDFSSFYMDFNILQSIKISAFSNRFYIEYNLFCILFELEKNNFTSAIDLLEFTISEINDIHVYSNILDILEIILKYLKIAYNKSEFDFIKLLKVRNSNSKYYIISEILIMLMNIGSSNFKMQDSNLISIMKRNTYINNIFIQITLTFFKQFSESNEIINYYDFKNLYLSKFVILLNDSIQASSLHKSIYLYKISLVLFFSI